MCRCQRDNANCHSTSHGLTSSEVFPSGFKNSLRVLRSLTWWQLVLFRWFLLGLLDGNSLQGTRFAFFFAIKLNTYFIWTSLCRFRKITAIMAPPHQPTIAQSLLIPPSPVIPLFEFRDADEFAPAIKGADVELIQTSANLTGGRVTEIHFGSVTVQYCRIAFGCLARASIHKNPLSMMIPLKINGPAMCNGFSMNHESLLVHGTGADYYSNTPTGFEWALLPFKTDAIRHTIASLTQQEPPEFRENCLSIRPPAEILTAVHHLLTDAVQTAQRNPHILTSQNALHSMEQSIHTAIALVLSRSRQELSRYRRQTELAHSHVRQRVEAYLEGHLLEPVYLADLCSATGVSERTLEQVFRESYGVSPLRYLKLRRLNLARQRLRDGMPEQTRVTDVALDCGFWELGRFAMEYAAVFGESPSHTLRRRAL
jgi:AraC-like DNA-binding protein